MITVFCGLQYVKEYLIHNIA